MAEKGTGTLSPTPAKGVIKGMLIIIFGLVFGAVVFAIVVSSRIDYTGSHTLWIGLALFIIVFGLGVWRGIVAILRRNRKRVSSWTIMAWALLIIVPLAWLFWSL